MELVGILNYTDEETPFAAQPSTEEFRSAKILPRENIFYRSFLQVNFERVCVFPIKFTKVSITPYGFFEIADAQKTFKDFSVQGINYSAGGAVALYVESPVNLIFSFGAKASLFSEPAVKFHFAVNMSLY